MTTTAPAGASTTVVQRIAEMPGSLVIRISQVLIAVHLLLRAIVFGSGYFYFDDYLLMGRSARLDIFSESFLLYDHNGHLMPGGMFITGILERLAPLNYWLVLLAMLLLQFLATWLTYRLLRLLLGARPALLIPVAVATLAPMTLLPGAWYAAAINFLPLQIAAAGAGIALLRGMRGGSRWWYVLTAVWVVVGLVFFEKSVLIPVTLLAIAVAGGGIGSNTFRLIASALRRTWLAWVLIIPIVLGYLVYYLGRVSDQVRDLSDTAGIISMVVTTVTRGVFPSLIGGPLTWAPAGLGTAFADPAIWMATLGCIVVVGLAGYGLWQSPRSRAVWLLAGIYLMLDLTIMAIGRSGFGILENLGLSLRYTVDSFVVILIAIAVTIAPPAGEDDSLRARQTRRRMGQVLQRSRLAPPLAGIAVVILGAFTIASHANLISPLTENESRGWLTNVRQSVADAGDRVEILDGPVPPFVLDGLNTPYNDFSWVLAPLSEEVRVQPMIYRGAMFDEAGRFVPARVAGIDSFPGPNGDCGWAVTDAPVEIFLGGDVFPWRHTLRLSYLVAANVGLTAQLGDGPPVDIDLREGLGEVFVSIEGGGPVLTVTPQQSDFGICIAQASIGALEPLG